MRRDFFKFCLMSSALIAFCSSAFAETLTQKLERLESDVDSLQRRVYRGDVIDSSEYPLDTYYAGDDYYAGDADAEIAASSAIEQQLASMTDDNENLVRRVDGIEERIDGLAADIDRRLIALEEAEKERKAWQEEMSAKLEALEAKKENPVAATEKKSDNAKKAEDKLDKQSEKNLPSVEPKPEIVSASVDARSGVWISATSESAFTDATLNEAEVKEAGANVAKSESKTSEKIVAAPRTINPEDAEAEYQRIYALVQKKDYEKAEKAWRSFVKDYPDSDLMPNALYWLGETYYARGNFEKAASTFRDCYQRYPKSAKAEDALLKLGLSYKSLKRNKEACYVFKNYTYIYPEAPERLTLLAEKGAKSLSCK